MADNPYTVAVPNALQALMAGEEGFKGMRGMLKERQTTAAREEAAKSIMQGGDTRSAIARLIGIGDMQGASTLANMGNNERDFNFRQQEAQRQQGNTDRSFGLQEKQFNRKSESVVDQVEQRRRAAASLGFDASKPGYESYLLTGKMPREDQQPLTATDKKAIIEADEGVLAGEAAIEGLKRAKDLSPDAYVGPYASQRGYGMSLLGDKSGEKTVELENLITTNALTQLKSIFGGMPTEGERKILLEVQGSVKLPDAARQKIYDRAMTAANKRLEFNRQRASAMRGGTFYRPNGGAQPQDGPQGSAPISKQQYDALPSGSPFTAPDGSQRVKP